MIKNCKKDKLRSINLGWKLGEKTKGNSVQLDTGLPSTLMSITMGWSMRSWCIDMIIHVPGN